MSELEQGSIVWASVTDPRGNTKHRPLVILTHTSEIILNEPIVAAPITTTFPNPAPDYCVPIPWYRGGHPVTGLTKRSAVICNWRPIELRQADAQKRGSLPEKYMVEVLRKVAKYNAQPE